jgi:hypothetical protein
VTRIQQVLLEMETPYLGHPYFVTGNGLFTALARRVGEAARVSLQCSHGVFVPGEYGSPVDGEATVKGGRKLGQSLPDVEAYADLFVHRDSAHRWVSESRPRDAVNTHALQQHGRRVAFADEELYGRPDDAYSEKRRVSWGVHCYLHADGDDAGDVLPVREEHFDGLQIGGARNYGFGALRLVDTQVVDLDALDYGRIEDADAHRVELLTPFVAASEYPGADSQSVPWWWDAAGRSATGELRRRTASLVKGDDVYEVETIDHGQTVPYAGSDPVQTARNGVARVGTHSRFGFGELRIRPAGGDRVPERVERRTGGDA